MNQLVVYYLANCCIEDFDVVASSSEPGSTSGIARILPSGLREHSSNSALHILLGWVRSEYRDLDLSSQCCQLFNRRLPLQIACNQLVRATLLFQKTRQVGWGRCSTGPIQTHT